MTSQNTDPFSWEPRITSKDIMIMKDAFRKRKDLVVVSGYESECHIKYEFNIISIYMKIHKRQIPSEKYSILFHILQFSTI
jgi:hypothetical protein